MIDLAGSRGRARNVEFKKRTQPGRHENRQRGLNETDKRMVMGRAAGMVGCWKLGGVGRACIGGFGATLVMRADAESLRNRHRQHGQQQDGGDDFSEVYHDSRKSRGRKNFVNPGVSQDWQRENGP